MNKRVFTIYIIISIILLLGACQKRDYIGYTGLYKANIFIKILDNSEVRYDTSFQSLIIVNQVYGDNIIQLQWGFDNTFIIDNKIYFFPNTIEFKIIQSIFSNKKKLIYESNNSNFFNIIKAEINENELVIQMDNLQKQVFIQIDAVKYQD